MATRLMFIRQSSPLVNTSVHIDGLGEFRTDDQGFVALERELTQKTSVTIMVDGTKIGTTVEPRTDSGMYVVDVGRASHDALLAGGQSSLGDRYEFLRSLGQGGMGVVVEAQDRLLERRVAIKMLSHELQEVPEAREIFLIEGQALAKLSHPSLVSVFDVAEIEGKAIMVMEYIEGRTLESVLKSRKLVPEHDAVEYAIQLLSALSYLHDQGTIHRDIKPANLMVEQKSRRLKIIDFGLARSFEQLAARGTQVRGTPGYMAPEQIRGEDLTAATDIYQVGATLFEIFSGRLPFEEAIMVSHLKRQPPRIETINPEINAEIADIIHSCLYKDPTARPDAGDLIRAFETIRSGGSSELALDARSTFERYSGEHPSSPTLGREADEALATDTNSRLTSEQASGLTGGVIGLLVGLILAVVAGIAFMVNSNKPDDAAAAVVQPEVEPQPTEEPTEPIAEMEFDEPVAETIPVDAAWMGTSKAVAIAKASSDAVAPALLRQAERTTPRKSRSKRKEAPKPEPAPEVADSEPVDEPLPVPEIEPAPAPAPEPEPEPKVEAAAPAPKKVPAAAARTTQPKVEKKAEPKKEPNKKKKKRRAPVSF